MATLVFISPIVSRVSRRLWYLVASPCLMSSPRPVSCWLRSCVRVLLFAAVVCRVSRQLPRLPSAPMSDVVSRWLPPTAAAGSDTTKTLLFSCFYSYPTRAAGIGYHKEIVICMLLLISDPSGWGRIPQRHCYLHAFIGI